MSRKPRTDLAFAVVLMVFAIGALAVQLPSALPVFERLLPALTLVLGYYFGQKG